jgi:hypothetical protein
MSLIDPAPFRDYCLRRISEGHSWSELAMRCGAIQRDRKGNQSGDTTWLKRRLGLMAESGGRPTTGLTYPAAVRLARGLGIDPVDVGI